MWKGVMGNVERGGWFVECGRGGLMGNVVWG